MAKYFRKFPKLLYSFDDYTISSQYVTNILHRFTFEDKLKNNTSAYFFYDIKDGDTPEVIAHKYYGSAYRHWIVLLFNDIIDPQYQWPLTYDTLNKYIDSKYQPIANTSVSGEGIYWAKSNIHSYYRIETTQLASTNAIIDIQTFEIDQNTYINLAADDQEIPTYQYQPITLPDGTMIVLNTDSGTKTYYEYEMELNENKRRIKLLKQDLISGLELEIEKVFADV